jgi:hypothetical protein
MTEHADGSAYYAIDPEERKFYEALALDLLASCESVIDRHISPLQSIQPGESRYSPDHVERLVRAADSGPTPEEVGHALACLIRRTASSSAEAELTVLKRRFARYGRRRNGG